MRPPGAVSQSVGGASVGVISLVGWGGWVTPWKIEGRCIDPPLTPTHTEPSPQPPTQTRFENDRTISFIPPDGEFDLMTYRLSTHVKPLIWVEAVVEPHSHSRIEYMIKVRIAWFF